MGWKLRIESWSNSARTLLIRGRTLGGAMIDEQHITNADKSKATSNYGIPEPPEFLNIYPKSGPVRRGECYVRAILLLAGRQVRVLSAGYLTESKTITWPPGLFESFTQPPGLPNVIAISNPGSGNEISYTVPTNTRYILRAIRFDLTSDSNAASRRVYLYIDAGSGPILYVFPSPITQDANETKYYYFAAYGNPSNDISNEVYITIPADIVLFQGWRIRTSTSNLQTGDVFSNIRLIVEEWIEE